MSVEGHSCSNHLISFAHLPPIMLDFCHHFTTTIKKKVFLYPLLCAQTCDPNLLEALMHLTVDIS